jgi:hypothetical protein
VRYDVRGVISEDQACDEGATVNQAELRQMAEERIKDASH